MLVRPYCETRRAEHFGICTTLRISTANYFEEDLTEHPGLELCYTVGQSHYYRQVRGRSWHLVPGQLMVLNGFEPHLEECSKSPTIPEIRSVIIEPGFVDSVFPDALLNARECVFDQLVVPLSSSLRVLLDAVFSLKATPQVSRIAYDCLMTELVAELALSLKHSASDKLRALEMTGHFPGYFVKAKRLIREHVLSGESLDLETIARSVGVSKFHFVRAFKQCAGISPIQYLNAFRVDLVKQRIVETRTSMIEIASELGYGDLSTFNKAFKKFAGVSPSVYRGCVRGDGKASH